MSNPHKPEKETRNLKRPTVVLSPKRMAEQMGSSRHTEPYWRPKTRADCVNSYRPCPFLGCKYHLASDVLPDGSLRLAFGEDLDALDEMPATCALDVAQERSVTLERIAEMSNLTRERVRQIEVTATLRLRGRIPSDAEDD